MAVPVAEELISLPFLHQRPEMQTSFAVSKGMACLVIVMRCSLGKGDILAAGKSLTLQGAEPLAAPQPGALPGACR